MYLGAFTCATAKSGGLFLVILVCVILWVGSVRKSWNLRLGSVLYFFWVERSPIERGFPIPVIGEVDHSMYMLNQYSFVVVGSIILLIVTLVTWRFVTGKSILVAVGLVMSLLIIAQIYLSNRTDQFPNVGAFQEALQSGRPLVVALYSNYWIGCLSAKPAVDRLESELRSNIIVVRINISSSVGAYIRDKYRAKVVPTYIAFDRHGEETWRQIGGVPLLRTILSLNL